MRVADAVAFAGHEVHVCRYREAGTLLRWLGEDLRGQRVLDVAGGDGYWAAQARKRGAWEGCDADSWASERRYSNICPT